MRATVGIVIVRSIGQTVDATVTALLRTTAGRMIFARPREDASHSR